MALSAGEIEILLKMKDEASAQMQRVQGTVERSTSAIKTAIVAGFSVTAVTMAVHRFADFAGKLTDLSTKTGVSTSGLQKLNLAFEQNGVSLTAVTTAIAGMARRLVGGDDAAVNALAQMGLKVQDLTRMQPDKAFLKIADAIAKIENPMERARVAMDVFGRQGREVLAGFTGHLEETTESFERMGLVISDDLVAAGDEFGDALTVIKTAGMAMLAQMLRPILPAMVAVAQAVGYLARTAIPALQGAFNAMLVAGMRSLRFFYDFMAGMAEAGSRVPLFGRALGATAGSADLFRQKSEFLTNAITSMTVEVRRSETAMKAMPPVVGEYGNSAKEAAKRAQEVEEFQVKWNESLQKGREELIRMDIWLTKFNASLTIGTDELGKLVDMTERINRANDEFRGSVRDFPGLFSRMLVPLKETVEEYEKAEVATRTFEENLGDLAQAFAQLAQVAGGTFGGIVQWIGTTIAAMNLGVQAGNQMREAFAQIRAGGTQNVLSGMMAMAGGIASATGSMIQATGSGNTLQRTLGGMTTGAAIGTAIFPGLGTAVGAAAGALIGFARGAFGVSESIRQARTDVAGFQAQLDTLASETQRNEAAMSGWGNTGALTLITVRDAFLSIGRSAEEAEQVVLRLWDTDHPDRARAAMEEINRVLAEQQSDMQRLEGAMERYGISWEQLGEAARNARLHELGNEIIQDFTVLINAGANAEFVIEKMGDAINRFVQSAVRTGGEVPAAMRPMLEQMIEMGLLTDENGEKLTDLSSITFAESLTQGFDRVVDRLNQILQALGWSVPQSFDHAGDAAEEFARRAGGALNGIPRDINIRVRGEYEGPELDAPGFAHGTRGQLVDFGRESLVRLHGREQIRTEAEVRRDDRGSGGSAELLGLKAMLRDLPRANARAIADAIALAGGRP